MTETTSYSYRASMLFGAAMLCLSSNASACSMGFTGNQAVCVGGTLLSEVSSSCSRVMSYAMKSTQDIKALKIRSLRGKYRALLTPGDEFARLKQEEICRER